MEGPSNLERLSAAEKDALIGELWSRVAALTATVAEMQGRLAKNSRNSRIKGHKDQGSKDQAG